MRVHLRERGSCAKACAGGRHQCVIVRYDEDQPESREELAAVAACVCARRVLPRCSNN